MPNWRTMCTSLTSARAGRAQVASGAASADVSSALRSIIIDVLPSWFMFVAPIRGAPFAKASVGASWTHAILGLGAEPRAEVALGRIDESAQIRPRLARIDDVLDAEGLGCPKGRCD